ncbi:MAG: hypothetical protein HYY06_13590 [Deltaproteobacteria bacterium]|nr:hypothetical protein [Deltaproteobacteria bacterium]
MIGFERARLVAAVATLAMADGWAEPVADNRELFLNATAWLVGDRK